jgi:hypothetical protein
MLNSCQALVHQPSEPVTTFAPSASEVEADHPHPSEKEKLPTIKPSTTEDLQQNIDKAWMNTIDYQKKLRDQRK